MASLSVAPNPLGDGFEVEGSAQQNHAVHQCGGLLVFCDARHERPVDLQHVNRELPEVGEGRVAGAKVVDGQANTALDFDRACLDNYDFRGRSASDGVLIEDPAHVVLPRSAGDPRVAHDVQRPRRSAAPVHSCSITSDAARTAVRSPTPCPASIWI